MRLTHGAGPVQIRQSARDPEDAEITPGRKPHFIGRLIEERAALAVGRTKIFQNLAVDVRIGPYTAQSVIALR